jgi:uncharacterized protein YbaR (Trm112 family)
MDNLLCPECEKRLSVIEAEYAKTLLTNQEKSYYSNIDKNVAFAFWLSIIWRMLVSRRHNLKLSPQKEELIRYILDEHLGESIDKLKDLSPVINQNNIFYKLLRSPNYTQNEAGFVFCKNQNCEPLGVVIGEFVLFFYTRKRCKVDKNFSLFGFEDYRKNCNANNLSNNEFISVINSENFKKSVNKFIQFSTQETIKSCFKKLDLIHANVLKGIGTIMPTFLKVEIIEDMINNNKLGRRHGDKALANSAFKIIKKHIHLYPYMIVEE